MACGCVLKMLLACGGGVLLLWVSMFGGQVAQLQSFTTSRCRLLQTSTVSFSQLPMPSVTATAAITDALWASFNFNGVFEPLLQPFSTGSTVTHDAKFRWLLQRCRSGNEAKVEIREMGYALDDLDSFFGWHFQVLKKFVQGCENDSCFVQSIIQLAGPHMRDAPMGRYMGCMDISIH